MTRRGQASLSIGSVQVLLAMKLLANRRIRDSDDIGFPLDACGVGSVEDAQAVYETYHAQEVLSASATPRIDHWLAQR